MMPRKGATPSGKEKEECPTLVLRKQSELTSFRKTVDDAGNEGSIVEPQVRGQGRKTFSIAFKALPKADTSQITNDHM